MSQAKVENALAVYSRVTDPLAYCQGMAKAAASAAGVPLEQGEAVMIVCMSEGITPYDYRRRYHTTPFGPAMRADAMRAEFRMNHGGDFEIVENTPDCGHIRFTDAKGRKFDSRITWAEAQGEPWPWTKGCGPGTAKTQPTIEHLKDNWATPLSRMNMLIARATSRGLRLLCPELVAGVYTPEEIEDVASATPLESNGHVPARPTASQILSQQAVARSVAAPDETIAADGEIIDAEHTVVATTEVAVSAVDATTAEIPKGDSRRDQHKTINDLGHAVFGDNWPAMLAASLAANYNGASDLQSLSKEDAKVMIGRLRERQAAIKNANSPN